MEVSTTITKKWQMTLPKEIRLLIGIKKPGRVVLSLVDKKLKTLRIKKEPSLMDLAGSIPLKNRQGKKIDILNIRDYMEKNYRRI